MMPALTWSAPPAVSTAQSIARIASIWYDGPTGGVYSSFAISDDSDAGNASTPSRRRSSRSGSVACVPSEVARNSTFGWISLYSWTDCCGL
jgi:hypothetical protein